MMMIIGSSVKGEVLPGLGVNWGNIASHPLNPNIVVNMLKDNGIKKVKLFDADDWTVSSFAGTGIQVMVAIPNNMLSIMARDYDNAHDWVKENVTRHLKPNGGADIRYVAVGNEPFLKAYNGSFDKTTFPALKNIQKALDSAKVGDKIKAVVPLNADVYEGDKPSQGDFRKDVKVMMMEIVNFLSQNNAPFVVNIYPFISLHQTAGFPFGYAFFDGGSSPIRDKNIAYYNVFDANFDTLVWTLKKNGHPNMKIIVGEAGWPTDGAMYGSQTYAKKFYDGLLKKLASKKGTPLRPGPLEVYLFSLTDENKKSTQPGSFERHWGIFGYDGKPKFPMDLTGKGNDKTLIGAKGVEYLPSQWCILDKSKKRRDKLPGEIDYACSLSDCTSLSYGSSCSHLDLDGNYSYAFNMYFQMSDQDAEACDFGGMATVVKQNASKGTCLFPIQIISHGETLNLGFWTIVFLAFVFPLFIFM
ncbi:glucan endo-1,3-beta-glucosidase 8-like [Euphorbia lathyris]|uniref:glucan endo-1,3-beta-glucosidase 8-like n=1 Tax=Euphorbia lathyris TaxID=212925 RepID=UPI003313BEA4